MTQSVEQHFAQLKQDSPQEAQKAMRNYREAMLEVHALSLSSKLSSDILEVQELTGNTIAKAMHGKIKVDPVAFRSKEELMTIFAHEIFHLEGIYNDGLIQQKIAELGIPGIKSRARQDYKTEQSKVAEITNRIGIQFTINHYKQQKFTEMFEVFKIACLNEGISESNAKKMFFTAFRELEMTE